MITNSHKDIVVIAWNGTDEPMQFIGFDEEPQFSIFLFNYSGNEADAKSKTTKYFDACINQKTEFKGEVLAVLAEYLSKLEYRYVGILDDDQEITTSAINQLLKEAASLDADLFQPSITHDSYHSHACFLQQPHRTAECVSWVEIMSPFLRKQLFESGLHYYRENISSYGIDLYLFPYLQKKLGMSNTYLIHKVALKHNKRVTDGSKRFSNGLDARQEGELLRKKILEQIEAEKIDFTAEELKQIYGMGTIRWQTLKYNIKRKLSFMN
jgi:hypothetical protein